MNELTLLLIETVISVITSITIMLLIAPSLKSALLDLCPTEKQANFWLAYTRTMMLISPLLLVLLITVPIKVTCSVIFVLLLLPHLPAF